MFKRKKTESIPDGFCVSDIRIESSICNGEKTIGFYDEGKKKLYYSELVRKDEDIEAFYNKYGIKR